MYLTTSCSHGCGRMLPTMACYACYWFLWTSLLGTFERCQVLTKFFARSKIVAHTSATSWQTLKFRCFQRLHNVAFNCWFCSTDNVSNIRKMATCAEVTKVIACWIAPKYLSCVKPRKQKDNKILSEQNPHGLSYN